ncbi:lyase family protein [Streptomyces sp. A1547]|uniref:lyase family protein n=1 Tax=Streptomyces sp. A1547 TaxID=2563105 RepID=UPI00109E616F|nr:lyase family protein [Streptomyces sp. A1547]THA38486.1 3-carboxy-cis,cis-muconate cycloisomerase [Streptomyces sp. A1547]
MDGLKTTPDRGPGTGRQAGADTGLLSPVRAGTATEAALTDSAWAQAMLDAEAALARAQSRLGTVPAKAAETITACARAEAIDLPALAVRARGAGNPVVALVEELTALVAAEDPAAAEYVHRGSTSQDILDTGAMLVTARTLRLVRGELDRTAAALARLADEHRGTPAAARTLGQHAVPTTFGLKAAGWLVAVLDARRRVAALLDGGLPVQLGGAAGTLAGYLAYAQQAPAEADGGSRPGADPGAYAGELIGLFAAETGLAEPVLPWHTLRTPISDTGAVLAHAAVALGKFATDVQTLARTELGEVAEPAGVGRGVSSAMPQKRNPVLAAMIRSAALQVPSLVLTLTHCAAAAEDERPAGAWHGEWQPLREALRLVGGAACTAAELAEGLEVHPARMEANLRLTGGAVVTERLAAVLAPVLGKAGAKRLVSRVAVDAGAGGAGGSGTADSLVDKLLADAPELAAEFTAGELARRLSPAEYTGAAEALVERALAYHRSTPGTRGTTA